MAPPGPAVLRTRAGTPVPLPVERWMGEATAEATAEEASVLPRAVEPVLDSETRARKREDTLLALELNGGPLALDHGFPVRLIGPNRPGVPQTQWVGRLTVR